MNQDIRERLVQASLRATYYNQKSKTALDEDKDKEEQIDSSSPAKIMAKNKHGNESDVYISKERTLRNQEIIDYT